MGRKDFFFISHVYIKLLYCSVFINNTIIIIIIIVIGAQNVNKLIHTY